MRAATAVAYQVDAAGPVRVGLYDVLGRELAVLADGTHAAGPHRAALDARGLAPGAYVVVLEAAGVQLTQRLALTR